jgi:hypothetical protein
MYAHGGGQACCCSAACTKNVNSTINGEAAHTDLYIQMDLLVISDKYWNWILTKRLFA